MSKNLKKVFFDQEEEIEFRDQEPKITIVDEKEKSLEERLPDFDVKSEYASKDVKLRELTDEEKKSPTLTTVKVYQEDGVTNVSPEELDKFINQNKRIKKVVIEKISVEDAARISMLFGSKSPQKPKLAQSDSVENLKKAELSLNFDFIGEVPDELDELPSAEADSDKALSFNMPLEEEDKAEISEVLKSSSGESYEDIASLESEINSDLSEAFEENYPSRKVSKLKPVKKKGLSLKEPELPAEDPLESIFEENEHSAQKELTPKEELKDKTLHYDKQTFTRKKNTTHNGYYYRAKDHMELYKVGSSYMVDYNNGLKSLAFSGNSLKAQREKSVFGVTSYFNYHIDVKICIITMSFFESFYHEIIGELDYSSVRALDEDFEYKVFNGEGFDILEFTELKKIERKLRHYDFEYFLDVLVESYDLILWDLPDMEVLNSNRELYFPIVRTLDNVSIIVGENFSKFKHIEEIIDYFKRYQINIKGVLVNKDKR
jgi:hypothetical protein